MTLSQLSALAAAATPGPWISCRYKGNKNTFLVLAGDEQTGNWVAECKYLPTEKEHNAAFIAACSPEVIAALVRVAEAAGKWREHGPGQSHCEDEDCPCTSAVCQLKKAVDALSALESVGR